jgi:hypothetical protein
MADPAYNGGGLIGFDSTTTGGNTNSGNNNSTPNPPKSPPPPIPTPPKQNNPPQPKPQKTILDALSSVSKPITPSLKPVSKNIREIIDDGIVEKQVVGDFEEKGSIRLSGDYPQNFVDVPKYDLSKITVIEDGEVNFNFILCLKDGVDSLPRLFAAKDFYEVLIKNYNEGNPFGVNDIIEEKNIVVIDIVPLKAKVEDLRIEELNLDINLSISDEKKYVEVLRNLFVHSNYEQDSTNGLKANPTYTDIELLRYISWVISKPSNNYEERLLTAKEIGDFGVRERVTPSENEPSEKVEETTVFDNRYPPIGREGVEDEEEAIYDSQTWVWLDDEKFWSTYDKNRDPRRGGGWKSLYKTYFDKRGV